MQRTLKAPRQLVFDTWTQARHLSQWWPPHHFDSPHCEVEKRVGGIVRCDMRGPDGTVYPNTGRFLEIDEPSRLVIESELLAGTKIIMRQNTIVTLEEAGDKLTNMTVEVRILHLEPEAAGAVSGMTEGWSQSLEKLDTLLATF
jgi:uncharacterized protein YndB with AHSA1/START domain